MRGRGGESKPRGGTDTRSPRSSPSGRTTPYAPVPDSYRHATWLELFFDLVFVFAVAELGHYLHGHLTFSGLLGFAFLFLPVWRVWMAFSYYSDIFDSDGVIDRAATVASMFGVVVLGLTIYGAFDGGSAAFAAAYSALRLLLVGLYVRAWRPFPGARDLCARYVAGFSVVAGLWALSMFAPEPWRFVLWGLALLADLATSPPAGRRPRYRTCPRGSGSSSSSCSRSRSSQSGPGWPTPNGSGRGSWPRPRASSRPWRCGGSTSTGWTRP